MKLILDDVTNEGRASMISLKDIDIDYTATGGSEAETLSQISQPHTAQPSWLLDLELRVMVVNLCKPDSEILLSYALSMLSNEGEADLV